MKTKKIEILAGETINSACKEAVILAIKDNINIEFDFNGQVIIASPDSDPKILANNFMAESHRRHEEYINSDEYKRKQEEYERKELKKKEKLATYLKDGPAKMTLKDEFGWTNACEANTDPYGGAVIIYAELWARLLEVRMAKGEQLQDISDECSHLADLEGITGFMYGCAVSILSQVWIHGKELRKWHNIKTQLKDEGEKANETGSVLNPALLNLG